MNEEKDLIKRYGKKQTFKVPEGYFENFAEDLMRKLPEKEMKAPEKISTWTRVKPWVYMAAMFVGLMFTVRLFTNGGKDIHEKAHSADTPVNYTELPDEYIDPIVNQTMMGDYELYKYLTEANPTLY